MAEEPIVDSSPAASRIVNAKAVSATIEASTVPPWTLTAVTPPMLKKPPALALPGGHHFVDTGRHLLVFALLRLNWLVIRDLVPGQTTFGSARSNSRHRSPDFDIISNRTAAII